MPRTNIETPVMKVSKPNGMAKQVLLFLDLQRQHPLREIIRIMIPMIKTGRAYPDWLMSISSPKLAESGGTTRPVWNIPTIMITILSINITVDIKAI